MSSPVTRFAFIALAATIASLFAGVGAAATGSSSSVTCTESLVPITASSQSMNFDTSAPETQLDVAAIINALNDVNSNYTATITDKKNATKTVSGTWDMYVKTCIPAKWNGNVQILTHGIGATHAYWEYPSNTSISYLDVSTSEGSAFVSYDRLGVGKSDHPDGLHVVQSLLDVEIAHQMVLHVKKDDRFAKVSQWIGVGHSYGSVLTAAVSSKYPSDFTKIVLTGFSASPADYAVSSFLAYSPFIAHLQNSTLFSHYANDTSYWVTESATHDLFAFFNGPPGVHYSAQVFNNFLATRGARTYGQALSQSALLGFLPATSYKGDVLIVTGAHDAAFCGGNCYQGTQGASVVEEAKAIFPAAKEFSTYIPANTAHAVFQHYSAPAVFNVINSWLKGTYK